MLLGWCSGQDILSRKGSDLGHMPHSRPFSRPLNWGRYRGDVSNPYGQVAGRWGMSVGSRDAPGAGGRGLPDALILQRRKIIVGFDGKTALVYQCCD